MSGRGARSRREFGRTVTVKIKYADFQQATRSRTLPDPVGSLDELLDISRELVRSVYPLTRGRAAGRRHRLRLRARRWRARPGNCG